MTRDRHAVAASLFTDAAVLTEMAEALLARAAQEEHDTAAEDDRHVAEQLQRISRVLRMRARDESRPVTEILIYRAPDAIAREAQRTAAIRASLANTRYADDEPAFRGPSFVGPAHDPQPVYR